MGEARSTEGREAWTTEPGGVHRGSRSSRSQCAESAGRLAPAPRPRRNGEGRESLFPEPLKLDRPDDVQTDGAHRDDQEHQEELVEQCCVERERMIPFPDCRVRLMPGIAMPVVGRRRRQHCVHWRPTLPPPVGPSAFALGCRAKCRRPARGNAVSVLRDVGRGSWPPAR